MARLRYHTAGESHGPALGCIIEGLPSGLELDRESIDAMLARRQRGHGRSARQRIESDRAEVLGGLRHGVTLGSPLFMLLRNRDHSRWTSAMAVWDEPSLQDGWRERPVTLPRPGHADFAGAARHGYSDARNVLERASARETAARTMAGAVAIQFLAALGVRVHGWVAAIGGVAADAGVLRELSTDELVERTAASDVACPDDRAASRMVEAIDAARTDADSLGGLVEVVVDGMPPGIGDYANAAGRLGGRLAQALMSVPAFKGVEVGDGFELAAMRGSGAHDELHPAGDGVTIGLGAVRNTNRAGGLEGGMTNGSQIRLRAAMKPLSTLPRPLASVDLVTGEAAAAHAERTDVCAVPAASVVAEAVVALEVAAVIRDDFGMAALSDLTAAWEAYRERLGLVEATR